MAAEHHISSTWDIFCRVVDNFGDAGVCWRLARMLCHEHNLQVRLWIDDLQTLQALQPDIDAAAAVQQVEGVAVCRWQQVSPVADDAAVVIEAFGCGLPDSYVAGMAEATRPPLWVVLEYLSAESWVDDHHGLSSPHPQLALPRYFFFPGFTPASGGLLRESGLLERRDRFGASARDKFWRATGFAHLDENATTISLFAYADAPVVELLATMERGHAPVVVALPAGALSPAVQAYCGDAAGERSWRRGMLEVRMLPFLPQILYDELLWSCDINFVRGEDSLVRALWAGRPLVWQPYRQDSGTHQLKMNAFLSRYCTGMAPAVANALAAFWQCWTGNSAGINAAWPALRAVERELTAHARRRAAEWADSVDMAGQLVAFVRNKVK